MAQVVATDVSVTVGGVDLSDHCTAATLNIEYDDINITAFGDTVSQHLAGLSNVTLDLTFQQDYASSNVAQTLNTNQGATATVVLKPTSSAASATNPSHTVVALLAHHVPIEASVGELMTFSVTWPCNSWTRATA